MPSTGSDRKHQILWIPGPILGMNEMLLARGRGHYAYNSKKKAFESELYYLCREQGITHLPQAWFLFEWAEKSKRRDPDNVAAGRKLVLDGLVNARRLPGDGWKQVLGWLDTFRVDKERPGVRVSMWAEKPQIVVNGVCYG